MGECLGSAVLECFHFCVLCEKLDQQCSEHSSSEFFHPCLLKPGAEQWPQLQIHPERKSTPGARFDVPLQLLWISWSCRSNDTQAILDQGHSGPDNEQQCFETWVTVGTAGGLSWLLIRFPQLTYLAAAVDVFPHVSKMTRETFISLKFKLIGEIVKPEVGKSQCKSQILVTDVADMYRPRKPLWDVADMYREMSQVCIGGR